MCDVCSNDWKKKIADEMNQAASAPKGNDGISREIALLREVFDKRFDRLEDCIAKMGKCFGKITEDVSELKKENVVLKSEILSLENRLNEVDRCDLNAVVFDDIPQKISEKQKFALAEVILKEMGIAVESNDLDECTIVKKKIGVRDQANSTQRDSGDKADKYLLIVRFTTRRMRERVMDRWRELKKSGSTTLNLFGESGWQLRMCERLSKSRRELFNKARAVAVKKGYKFVWMRQGEIFLRKKEKEKVVIVNCDKDIDELA
uniref:Putative crack-3 cq n=1 Tax=Nyssomyia neivai TaxID=330878 RepID=A0A1L8DAC2_9DIPT